jgi:predicted dehydrogenase
MPKTFTLGVLGCGDFLRTQADFLKASSRIKVARLFDTDKNRAARWAASFNAQVADTADAILEDPAIDIVGVWVPTFLHKDFIIRAASAGKHVIATKPLAPNIVDCNAVIDAIRAAKVTAATIYMRTHNPAIETIKRILASGEHGRLALYRRDMVHHYPVWNNWATDPAKNGGPFMDAAIHLLNIGRYLMGAADRPATACTFFSDTHNTSQKIACADTEILKIDFAGNGSALLFITWAAQLAIYSREGNFREGIHISYMITDQGWHITETTAPAANGENRPFINVTRDGKKILYPVQPPPNAFDGFANAIEIGGPLPSDLVDIAEAGQDIYIIEQAAKNLARRIDLQLPWAKQNP